MEKVTKFRDYQEEQAADHNALQSFARASLDHIVHDAVTASRRFSGFNVTKSSQTEVTIAPGRFYDQDGAVYGRGSALAQSMTPYLAAASKRIVLLSAYGVENDTDVTERDFLTNVDTGATEPDSVAMTSSRDAVVTVYQGTESADPQPPALPATQVAIAYVLLDTTQVVSITMIDVNRVTSTENLDVRTDGLEAFRDQIGPRVSSLSSDLAALANLLNSRGSARAITQLYQDVARLKELNGLPDTATDYGADRFLTTDESDVLNAQTLGYDCKVEEGIRFPDANADESELSIFSANDPNASLSNGLLLPAYTEAVKLYVYEVNIGVGIAQYGFQTFELTQLTMSRQRLRYGSVFTVCSNTAWWQSGTYDSTTNTFQKNGETFEVLDIGITEWGTGIAQHNVVRLRQIWQDTYQEPYWGYTPISHTVTGAQIAQSFLVSNDMWMTKFGFWVAVKAANEAIYLSICECTNGVPDLSKVVLHQMIPHTALVVNTEITRVSVQPTFLKAGKRYAAVLTSNANHQIGLSTTFNYVDGTFFYSTDGAYYQGDLTRDMIIEIWGAQFNASQVTIEFNPLNLDGGIRGVDILAGAIVPHSTDLIYEVQPSGSGAWIPLRPEDLTAFAATPPLVKFRGRFVGTRDMMPGLTLAGSRVHISRPKVAFKHVSTPITLASPSSSITVTYTVEGFLETPHDFTVQFRSAGLTISPSTTVTKPLSDLPNIPNRIERTFTFHPAAATSTFTLIETGATNSAGSTFNVSEQVHYAE